MTKADSVISLIIGFFIGLFSFIALKALQIELAQSWLILLLFPPLTLFGLFVASLIGRKFLAVYQLAKFVLVGAFNTFVDLGILNFLMWLSGVYTGVFFALFKAASFVVAATSGYLWNKHWTFEKRNGAFTGQEYVKFLVIVGAGLLINVSIASFMVNVIGPQFGVSEQLWANIGAFSAVFITVFWNFLGSKLIVFKK